MSIVRLLRSWLRRLWGQQFGEYGDAYAFPDSALFPTPGAMFRIAGRITSYCARHGIEIDKRLAGWRIRIERDGG